MKRLLIFLLVFLMPFSFAAAEEEFYLPGSLGNLYVILKTPPAPDGPVPLILLSHGFGGSHSGIRDYADYFVSNGFAACSLDFCGGGRDSKSDGTMLEMSVLTEAEDLNAVVDYFRDDPRFSSIYLWGESQGGFVSSYVAAGRPEDIAGLVLEYPAYVLTDSAKRNRQEGGSFPEESRLLGMRIGRVYYEALASIDIYGHIAAYGGPVLVLHGNLDWLVPLSYSERAAEAYPNAELIVMPGQGHGFIGSGRKNAMKTELVFFREHELIP